MAFLNSLGNRLSLTEAGLAAAAATLYQDGEISDLEKRILSLFRDSFSPLTSLDNATFDAQLVRAITAARSSTSDLVGFVANSVAPSVTDPRQKVELYRYCYALAMADLNVDDGEAAVLAALTSGLNIAASDARQAETGAQQEFYSLHRALAATVVGLMVVTADGNVEEGELENVRSARSVLEPIAAMDDVQFQLIFDLSLNIHDRFLLEATNRQGFLANIVTQLLNTHALCLQAFEYAASVATADGDIAQSEADMLKEMLAALGVNDADGEQIFNRYMGRVQTIDGRPR